MPCAGASLGRALRISSNLENDWIEEGLTGSEQYATWRASWAFLLLRFGRIRITSMDPFVLLFKSTTFHHILHRRLIPCESPVFNTIAQNSHYPDLRMKMSQNGIELIKMFYSILIYHKN